MKKIAFVNQKGGVGKSTSVVNVAACLAEKGKKVLIIDADPQGNATSGVGVDKRSVKYTTYEFILDDSVKPNDCIIQTNFEKLFVIPSNIELAGAEVELVSALSREKLLKSKLEQIKGFDYILIDCQPSLGLITINALTAVDSIIVPVQCEYYALEGLGQLMQTISRIKKGLNPELQLDGILVTMYDSRVNLSNQVVSELRSYFEDKVFRSIIPRNIRVSEAPSHGKPVIHYESNCSGSIAYRGFVEEYLGEEEKEQIESA